MSNSNKKEDNKKGKKLLLSIVLMIVCYLLLMLMCVLMEKTSVNTSSQFAPVMQIFGSSMLTWLKIFPSLGVLIVIYMMLPAKYDKYIKRISIYIIISIILFYLF